MEKASAKDAASARYLSTAARAAAADAADAPDPAAMAAAPAADGAISSRGRGAAGRASALGARSDRHVRARALLRLCSRLLAHLARSDVNDPSGCGGSPAAREMEEAGNRQTVRGGASNAERASVRARLEG